MFRLFIIPFLFTVSTGAVCAQSPLLEKLSIQQGLSQGFVPSIAQDDDGFLWFGTKNGLNRYDGYDFQVFRNDPFDSLSLGNNEILHIVSAGDFLFVASNAQESALFHRKTNRFFKIPNLGEAGIHSFHVAFLAGERSICAVFLEGKTFKIKFLSWPTDLAERKKPSAFFEIKTEPNLPAELWDVQISEDKKRLLLLAPDRILVRDLEKATVAETPLPTLGGQNLIPKGQETHRNRIWEGPDGSVWVFVNSRLARFDGRDWQVFQSPFLADLLLSVDQKSGLCWFRFGNEIGQIDLQKQPIDLRPAIKLTIEETLKSIFTDNFGNVWFGTDAHGIRKFSPRTAIFKNYLDGFSVYCQPVFNGKNHVVLTDLRRGGWSSKLLDLRSGNSQDLADFRQKDSGWNHSCATENGFFWLLDSEMDGKKPVLTRFDPETGHRETFPISGEIDLSQSVLRFVATNQIWIITPQQIVRFDLQTRQFSFFENPEKPADAMRAVERTADGTWWIGTTMGLIKAEPMGANSFRFSKMTAEKGNRNSLPTNSIKSLLVDPADPDVLWIGTDGLGMSRFDTKKGRFVRFSTKNGLPDDVVYGILADNETPRKLWISTNHGLTRFNPESGLFQYFAQSDGLPDNEFNTFSSFKSESGRLFFGTVNGLTSFDPKDLAANSKPPAVHFTGLKLNGEVVLPRDSSFVLEKDIAFLDCLELPFSKNNIALNFAATDFTSPERNQFAYFLKGAESEWAHRGFEHSAQYLNLAPGEYTFFVKAANSNGVWNDVPISIKILISPPFYRTWLAYLFYIGLVGGGFYFFYRTQLLQKLEHAEAERLKSLDAFKSRFFTNITHEFRTPLTVILGITEQLEKVEIDDQKRDKHGLVKRSGENLLRLINQILDLAKLESSGLKMRYVQGDVLTYLRYIAESLHSLANAQNLMLRVESDQSKIVMDYDPERLLQVVHNLLSNAIKFTASGGKVVLRAVLVEKWLHLSVTDTGTGIPADELSLLFDRFFQAKNQDHAKMGGAGIGLSLTRELVQAMGGDISVESTVGKGATFLVKLPMTNAAILDKDSRILGFQDAQKPLSAHSPRTHSVEKAVGEDVSSGKNSNPQILLIEDNPDVVEYLVACLGEKYRLDFAFNGRAGIEKAVEIVPDLIVSDVMMPEKDGFEVCHFLKNDLRTSHVPIILLTAKATVEDRIAGLRHGADTYLAKPFQQSELLVWVEQLIAQRRLLQARYSNPDFGFRTSDLPAAPPSAIRHSDSGFDLEYAFIQKVRVVLDANFANPDFSADALCQKMAMPRIPFHRKLHALTGQAIVEYINAFRLEKGRALLLGGSANVSEAAFQVGFNDPKYFTRLFTKTYGHAPKEARKQVGGAD